MLRSVILISRDPSLQYKYAKVCPSMQSTDIYQLVQSRYGELAERPSQPDQARPEESVAKAFGYEASDLAGIPQDANLGVGCGNPLAVANIREVSAQLHAEYRADLTGRNGDRPGKRRRY